MSQEKNKLVQESWTTYLLKGVLMYIPAKAAWATLNSNAELSALGLTMTTQLTAWTNIINSRTAKYVDL